MPVDASIILGNAPRRVELQDPLEQYGKSLTLRNLMQQGDINTLHYEKGQREASAEKRLEALFANNPNATPEDVMAIDPQRGMAYKKLVLEGEAKRSEIDKNKAETVGKAVAAHRDQLVNVTDPQSAAQWIASAYQDPILSPIVSRTGTLQDAIKKIPQDPAAFDEWRKQSALGATKFIEMNKPHVTTQDLGGTSQVVATPGLGGAPSVLSSTPKTITPGDAAHLDMERKKADPFGILGINKNPSPAATAQAGLSGEEYLKTLPPGVSSQVKALAEGKLAITPRTLQSPQGAALLQMAMQYEPGTDQTTYISRAATAKDAASGKIATSNNALNTVAGHLAGLGDAAEKLDNTSFPWVNKLKNAVANARGQPQVNAFNLNLMGVADELERAYRGAGGSAGEIENWKKTLGDSSSPEQFKGALAKGAEMLQSKIEANQAQIDQGMRSTTHGIKALTPKAEAAFAKLRGEPAKAKEAEAPKPQSFDALPDPAKFDGKFMTDTNTNTKYKSVGGKWVKQ